MRRHRVLNLELILGISIVAGFIAWAVLAPVLMPPEGDDPYAIPKDGYETAPKSPSPAHPLGTMQEQYDVLYGLVWGTRIALRVGLMITLGRALLGVGLGLISGYCGGWFDGIVMLITDSFLAFPIVAAALVMVSVLGGTFLAGRSGGEGRVISLSLVLFGWMQYARLVRGNVMAEMEKEYVRAATSIGAPHRRIIFRHVLPNATQGLWVLAASDVGVMVTTVAALTFIGLTVSRPSADWGMMLKFARNWIVGTSDNVFAYWYTYVPAVLAIVVFSIGWNLIGDGLRTALDPRQRMNWHSDRQRSRP
jgi:peptide/nickel transport system permease protein